MKEGNKKYEKSGKNTVEETRFRHESLPLYGLERARYKIEKS